MQYLRDSQLNPVLPSAESAGLRYAVPGGTVAYVVQDYPIMKRLAAAFVLFFFLSSALAVAQTQPPADPYKPVLDRLQAITTMPLDSWKVIGSDLPHGETPSGSLAEAKPVALKQNFQLPVWLYKSVEVPPALNGYSVSGSRVALNLNIGGNTGILISVFVNGNMVARGDQDSQVPIAVTQSAQPGQKLLIAVRVLPSGTVGCCGGPPETRIESASLGVQSAGEPS